LSLAQIKSAGLFFIPAQKKQGTSQKIVDKIVKI